jgi:excisionase family DNA binding protein
MVDHLEMAFNFLVESLMNLSKPFFTIEELAEYAGCSIRYIHDEKKRGNLRAAKVGKRLRFATEDVEKWLKKKVQVA